MNSKYSKMQILLSYDEIKGSCHQRTVALVFKLEIYLNIFPLLHSLWLLQLADILALVY